jgi:alginate O-acetyltransferase complex protein AlgI
MLFTTAQFVLFFAALLLLLRVLPRTSANPLLLFASLVFYTLWIPSYLPILLVDIGVNYALLRAMQASVPGSARRRLFFAASVVFTLSLLVYFKYAVFLVETALPLFRPAFPDASAPDILLPLGISFYTFQILSLAADLFPGDERESQLPLGGFGRYALYIAFFPQLIAGPILRGREFLPQLERGPERSAAKTRRGLWLLASGSVKKVVLADFLLAPFVESVFSMPGVGNASFHWVALYAFSFQIYFDFSGYTDIARGLALVLGYELPENFHEPFLSRSPHEFWNRWHMTLSRWLRLYLFTPISHTLMRRGGPVWDGPAVPVAQLVTMTLCGVWHGAGWNFAVWGILQGVLLVAWRFPRRSDASPLSWRDAPAILLFYQLFCLTLIVFRLPDAAAVATYLHGLMGNGLSGWPVLETGIVALCAALHVIERWVRPRAPALQRLCAARSWGVFVEAAVFGLVAGAVILASGAGGEFIYFHF